MNAIMLTIKILLIYLGREIFIPALFMSTSRSSK